MKKRQKKTVAATGFFGQGDTPFVDWNITEEVDDNGDLVPDRTFNFTSVNSTRALRQSPNTGLPVLEITENFIRLIDLSDLGITDSIDNLLTLLSPVSQLDQTVEYFNQHASEFVFTAGARVSRI